MMGEILSLEILSERLRKDRQQKSTVVLANGCFDLIHVGHLRYLEEAKQIGDILVVGVNSDRSVREIKGMGRPVLSEAERAILVGSFACVDFVFVFDEPSVERAIRKLRPDWHCKGTDYTQDTVPEAAASRSAGARIAITGDPKSHSSKDLITRVLDTFRATI